MTLLDRIQNDVKDAMRARDTELTTQLRMLVAALQDEAKRKLRALEEPEEIAILTRERKKRLEAATAFEGGGAADRAAKEREQMAMIEAYLPEQIGNEELAVIVQEAVTASGANNPSQMGLVMKLVIPKIQGRADGKVVKDAVQRALAGADPGAD